MAIIELVREKTVTNEADRARRVAASKKTEEAPAAEVVEEKAEAADTETAEAEAPAADEAAEDKKDA